MVKFITVNTVYGVGTSEELRAIASEDVAASIWGSNWNTLIDDISDAFYGNYTFGANIDSTSDFDPTVVKESVESILEIFCGVRRFLLAYQKNSSDCYCFWCAKDSNLQAIASISPSS